MEHPLSNAAKLALFEATTSVSKLGWRWKELIIVKLSDYIHQLHMKCLNFGVAYEVYEYCK